MSQGYTAINENRNELPELHALFFLACWAAPRSVVVNAELRPAHVFLRSCAAALARRVKATLAHVVAEDDVSLQSLVRSLATRLASGPLTVVALPSSLFGSLGGDRETLQAQSLLAALANFRCRCGALLVQREGALVAHQADRLRLNGAMVQPILEALCVEDI